MSIPPNNSWMSLPLKRKCESSPMSTGAVACDSSNLDRGAHTRRGRDNCRGHDRGHGHGHSFHIPKGASQTALLMEVWKHRTHGRYYPSSQLRPVPHSLPTCSLPTCSLPTCSLPTCSLPTCSLPPISPQIVDLRSPQPDLIAAMPELLHGHTQTV